MGTVDTSQSAGTAGVEEVGTGTDSLVRICSMAASTAEGLSAGELEDPASPSPLPLVVVLEPVFDPVFDAVLVVVLLLVKI